MNTLESLIKKLQAIAKNNKDEFDYRPLFISLSHVILLFPHSHMHSTFLYSLPNVDTAGCASAITLSFPKVFLITNALAGIITI